MKLALIAGRLFGCGHAEVQRETKYCKQQPLIDLAFPSSAETVIDTLEDAEDYKAFEAEDENSRGMSRFLLNIEKRSLPRLMLSGDGLASNEAV